MITPELIISKCKLQDIYIDKEKAEKIAEYSYLVTRYNQHTNITRNDSEDKMLNKNIIDSMRIVPYIENDDYVADIGCGAGFPGIVVSIIKNGRMVLIDSIKKKTDFVKEVIDKIGLNAEVINDRVENIARSKKYRESFDKVISRAAAPLNVLIEYSVPLLKDNGTLIAMKGSNVDEEIKNSNNAVSELKCEITEKRKYCNDDGIERCLLFINKSEKTPDIYPRDTKKINKKPL